MTRDTNAPLDTGRGAGVHYPRTSILKVHETPTGCKAQDAVPVIVALGDLGVSETYTERLPRLASCGCCEKGRGPTRMRDGSPLNPRARLTRPADTCEAAATGASWVGTGPFEHPPTKTRSRRPNGIRSTATQREPKPRLTLPALLWIPSVPIQRGYQE